MYLQCFSNIKNVHISLYNLDLQMEFIHEDRVLPDYHNLGLIQKILMIGYPSAIVSNGRNCPIMRVGIAATDIKERFNNEEIFLTDIPAFGGSSGSPIFVADETGEIFLVGINSQ